MTVAVRTDLTAAEVRELAKAAATPDQARRLLAIALVLEGANREDAARSTGMDRQTLRDWVHRFNTAGPAGLVDRKAPGRQRRLNQDQLYELAGTGIAILAISSELPEILTISDRIVTMREGRVTGEVMRAEASEERLMQLMALGRAEAA